MKSKLAIVIPAYKSRYLLETLEALRLQTNQHFKCYIADDASPENLMKLIEPYKDYFPLYYHRYSENLGRSSLPGQWSRSISLSGSEEWIWLLCDDDIPGLTCVQEFYEALTLLNREQINVLRFSTYIVNGDGERQGQSFIQPIREKSADFISRKIQGLTRSSLSEHIFRRTAYAKHGFVNFPLGWHTDDAAWATYAHQGIIYTSNNAEVAIRVTADSISGNKDNIENKFLASVQFIEWLLTSGYVTKSDLPMQTWLFAYYGIESYYINRQKKLTPGDFLRLWKIRRKCVGLIQSFKIVKILKLFLQFR